MNVYYAICSSIDHWPHELSGTHGHLWLWEKNDVTLMGAAAYPKTHGLMNGFFLHHCSFKQVIMITALEKVGIWGPELGIDGYVRLLADTSGNQVQEWSEWKGFWRGWGDVHTLSNSNLDLIASWTFPSNILHDSFCFCASQNKTIAFSLVWNAKKKQPKVCLPLAKIPWPAHLTSNKQIEEHQQWTASNRFLTQFFSFLSTLRRRAS